MKKKVSGECALCHEKGGLCTSHIIPAFVFRWKKNTSPTGYLRAAETPNQRAQDGLKQPWLCEDCEGLLNEAETVFATKMFHPLNQNPKLRVGYQDWMMKFCVSVSWRVTKYLHQKSSLNNLTETQKKLTSDALARWAEYLLGKELHPGQFEQHLVLMPGIIGGAMTSGMPKNINRYLLRAIEMDIAATPHIAFSFVKMGPFFLFGFIQNPGSKWKGSKINLKRGTFGGPTEYGLPGELWNYIEGRAHKAAKISASISDVQQEKIEMDILDDPNRFLDSGTRQAMDMDVNLFGRDALIRKPSGK
ncbi:MAG: hypothetical protein COB93_10125 [Sneathiella sp.]|nr:MAG: hypothetical protein COB93_10125 [Sneathiella sp.]